MRVSLKWLREYVDLDRSPVETAHSLTMSGTEVGAIDHIGANWREIYVGQVSGLSPHPNADRLQLVTVDYGQGRAATVVTGAFNLRVGDKVALALVGATLRDPYSDEPRETVLKPVKLRGVLSEGMVCSARELGLGEDHEGILVLHPEVTVGRLLAEEMGDVILHLEVTPNRADCLSMLGVAREVAALTGQTVRIPPADYSSEGPSASELVEVEIAAPSLCPRYSASVISGVTIGPSPYWLQARLAAAGIRSINNVVDVTNLVMLEWNQPLHAFDYDRIRGRRIIVRRGTEGETLRTIDDVDRTLNPDTLVIADVAGAVAVAGVMGGSESEVSTKTTTVLLESANFNSISIRRTARRLRITSEASRRFERGLPPEGTIPALQRATQLIQQLAGGKIARGVVDAYPEPGQPRSISLGSSEVKRLLGIEFSLDEMSEILGRLGFGSEKHDGLIRVAVPWHRLDVELPADLVEEIVRMVGYEAVPATLPAGPLPEPARNATWEWDQLIRQTLVSCGYTEVITYSLTNRQRLGLLLPANDQMSDHAAPNAPAEEAVGLDDSLARAITDRLAPLDIEPIRVLNPLSSELEYLRTTTFGSLLETLAQNLRWASRDLSFFEIGRIYIPRLGDLPDERRLLTAVSGAYRSSRIWGKAEAIDFFDIKGVAQLLFERLGLKEVRYIPVAHPTFHPAKAAAIILGSQVDPQYLIGVIGEVADAVRSAHDIAERAFLLAVDLDRLTPVATRQFNYRPIPRFPSVVQDIAIVVASELPSSRIDLLIRKTGEPLVRDVQLFDVFEGGTIPAGKRSLAYHIVYQSESRTLTDAEVAQVHRQIERALVGELGAQLRA